MKHHDPKQFGKDRVSFLIFYLRRRGSGRFLKCRHSTFGSVPVRVHRKSIRNLTLGEISTEGGNALHDISGEVQARRGWDVTLSFTLLCGVTLGTGE